MSGPSKPSWVSQSQMDEIKAFNASLSPAGNRSRAPPSGINRGGGSGFNPGRPTSTFAVPPPRTGSGVRSGPGTSWTVGPTTAQPQFKPASPRARSRSPSRAASTPTMIGPYTVGSQPGTTAPKPLSPSEIRNPALVAGGPILAEPRSTPAVVVSEPAGQFQYQPPPQGRELITSNMTPDDPSKPWIPAHLQQKSAFGAIRHLSEITGLALEELTSDGVSIPAVPKNRSVSANVPVAVSAQANTSIGQGYVDPNAWMSAYASRRSTDSGHITQIASKAASPTLQVASYSEMDVDMADDSASTAAPSQQAPWTVGTLEDSQWASAPATQPATFTATPNQQTSWKVGTLGDSQWASAPVTRPAAITAVPSTSAFQSHQSFGNSAQNIPTSLGQPQVAAENVRPAVNNPIEATSINFAKILAQAISESRGGKKPATLKDSRWA